MKIGDQSVDDPERITWTYEKPRNPVVRLHLARSSRNPFERSRTGGTDSDDAMTIPFRPIDPRRRLNRQGVTLPLHPVVFDKLFPYRLKGTWPYMQRQ